METGCWTIDDRNKMIIGKWENILMREMGQNFQLALKALLGFMPYVSSQCGMCFSVAIFNCLGASTRMAEIKI